MPTGVFPRPSLRERFESKIEPGRCPQEWQGSRDARGYGRIGVNGSRSPQLTHRVAWELANGPIHDGLYVCHHCDNPPCVTIAHLFLGTNSDNQLDSVSKGRHRSANELRKTHCLRGHPYTGDNLYIAPDGTRYCRECQRAAWRRNHPPGRRKESRAASAAKRKALGK